MRLHFIRMSFSVVLCSLLSVAGTFHASAAALDPDSATDVIVKNNVKIWSGNNVTEFMISKKGEQLTLTEVKSPVFVGETVFKRPDGSCYSKKSEVEDVHELEVHTGKTFDFLDMLNTSKNVACPQA